MTGIEITAFHRAAAVISAWRRPLLVSHVKPDGDALGALAAMRSIFTARGADPFALLFDELPRRFALFDRNPPMPVLGRDVAEAELSSVDGVLILDTCTYNQVEPIAAWLRESRRSGTRPERRRPDVLAVDHHVTRDDLADEYLIDESAAATCLILFEWARVEGWTTTAETHGALFVGIATDTGWLQYSNTDRRALEAAAELVGQGVVPHALYQQLYRQDTAPRVRLLGAALETLELLAEERLAVMTLSSDALSRCAATTADTEDIVNEPMRIGSVVVSVLLVEENGRIRVSFRSKPPPYQDPGKRSGQLVTPTGSSPPAKERRREASASEGARGSVPDVDVAQVAQAFGGGGHARAAGARIEGTLVGVKTVVVERLLPLITQSRTPTP